jgi:hypothetical protein
MSLAAAGCSDDEPARDAAIDVETDQAEEPDPACASEALDAASLDDQSADCAAFYRLPCGVPPTAVVDDCFPDLLSCADMCNTHLILYCVLAPSSCTVEAGSVPDASTVVECVSCTAGGRRPRGLRDAHVKRCSPLGDYFATLAHLESASVRAFRDVEASLVMFGAPSRLVRAARRAQIDERHHARSVSRLARRFGGAPPRPRVRVARPPSLVDLLEDDAVEGCAKETFGALVTAWQGERASDWRVKRTMARIAVDEIRHAALAWEILRWGLPRVSRREQSRILGKLDAALASIAGATYRVDDAVQRVAGHPAPADAHRLARGLRFIARREVSCRP